MGAIGGVCHQGAMLSDLAQIVKERASPFEVFKKYDSAKGLSDCDRATKPRKLSLKISDD